MNKQFNLHDKVWIFDSNQRVYQKDAKGNSVGAPIYREHFRPMYIIGETRKFYILGHEPTDDPERFAQNRYVKDGGVYTAQMVEDAIWANEHRWRISSKVDHLPAQTLRKVAEVIGYKDGD